MTSANFLVVVANHLWQSTLFATVAGLLTLVLKRNRAQARYALWVIASLKFLIPFLLLVSIGNYFGRAAGPARTPAGLSYAIEEIHQPFVQASEDTGPSPIMTVSSPAGPVWPVLLLAVWICGSLAVLLRWSLGWKRVTTLIKHAPRLVDGLEVEALQRVKNLQANETKIRGVVVVDAMEPGLFGILQPVLLLPANIGKRLDTAELEAILAHELSHANRYDNLWATIHMAVEILFWFHPLVWLLGYRLIDERERACDEDVLRRGHEPGVYAKAMLRVCEMYLASPLVCVSGISGSDLKNRVVAIMTSKADLPLSFVKKTLIAITATVALAVPILYGAAHQSQAQTLVPTGSLAFEVASVKLNKLEPSFSGASRAAKEAMLQSMTLQYLPGGRFSARGVPIPILIFEAYNVSLGRITLNPEFERSMDRTMETDRYDIDAVAEKGAIPVNASPEVRMQKIRLMFQNLLADRFKVRISHETKETPVYAIVVGKDGPKLQKSAMDEAQCAAMPDDRPQIGRFVGVADPTSCHAFVVGQGRELRGQAVDMSDLSRAIEGFTDLPVVNQTGLNGLFKIDVPSWPPLRAVPRTGTEPTAEERESADPTRPTISDVLQGLGLRLVPTKAAVEMFVVEHFERPAQN